MRPKLDIIADVDPGGVFRVVGTANTIEEAEAFIRTYRVENGPLVDVRILNHGRELKRRRRTAAERKAKKKSGSTQIKGGR